MTKWEYLVERLVESGAKLRDPMTEQEQLEKWQEALTQRGQEGWELIRQQSVYGIFKRPARPEPPALLVVNNIPGADFRSLIDSIKAELDRYWEEKEVRRDP